MQGVGDDLTRRHGQRETRSVHRLSLVAGLDVRRPALKLPGWGRIALIPGGNDTASPSPSRKPDPVSG